MSENPHVRAVMSGEEGDLHGACWALVESAGRDAYENAAFWRHIQAAVQVLFAAPEPTKPGEGFQRVARELAAIRQDDDDETEGL